MPGPEDGVGLSNPVPTSTDSPEALSKSYSCVVCHKRKVKCDRKDPCSNCERASVECIYRPPPPPRRRKREHDLDENASQSREKSRRHGTDSSHMINNNQRSSVPLHSVQSPHKGQAAGSGRMIMKDGKSVYIDKWVQPKAFCRYLTNLDIVLYGQQLVTRLAMVFYFSWLYYWWLL
jgi:hypothetical protein